jgi:hypothetical protein
MDFLQKYFNGVFELHLPRNARKRTKQKKARTQSRMAGGWVWDVENVWGVRVRRFFVGGPSRQCTTPFAQFRELQSNPAYRLSTSQKNHFKKHFLLACCLLQKG